MPDFIKFSGLGGEQTHDSHGNTFLKIDSDFQQLANVGADDFLKIEASQHIKHDITTVGDWFIKLDGEFLKIDEAAWKYDAFAIKLTNTTPTDAAAVELPAVQRDFLKLDLDLKVSASDLGALGTDFIKLDTAPDLETFKVGELKVSSDFLKISDDISADGADLKIIGDDLIKLSTGGNSRELSAALKLLGGQDYKISSAFDAVSADFLKISQDFATLGGGRTTSDAVLVASLDAGRGHAPPAGPLGADFFKLEQDFHVLNQALAGGFSDAGRVIDALFDQAGGHLDHQMMDQIGPGFGGLKTDQH